MAEMQTGGGEGEGDFAAEDGESRQRYSLAHFRLSLSRNGVHNVEGQKARKISRVDHRTVV
jgi:hypothetical protein